MGLKYKNIINNIIIKLPKESQKINSMVEVQNTSYIRYGMEFNITNELYLQNEKYI